MHGDACERCIAGTRVPTSVDGLPPAEPPALTPPVVPPFLAPPLTPTKPPVDTGSTETLPLQSTTVDSNTPEERMTKLSCPTAFMNVPPSKKALTIPRACSAIHEPCVGSGDSGR